MVLHFLPKTVNYFPRCIVENENICLGCTQKSTNILLKPKMHIFTTITQIKV